MPTQHVQQMQTWTLTGVLEKNATPQMVEVLHTPFRIGRKPTADLSLNSKVVSGEHAELVSAAGLLALRDLGSTNGSFVNGVRVTEDTLLAEGDWLELGDLHLRVDRRQRVQNRDTVNGSLSKTHVANALNLKAAEKALAHLIANRSLEACFQPIHDTSNRDVFGYEYLARSEVEFVSSPGMMFSTAASCGREIELSVLCRDMAVQHSACLPQSFPLFVNTHPAEDLLRDVIPQMRNLRDKAPGRPLVLELHEDSVTDPELVRVFRQQLSEFDVQLAFDDFGAGNTRIRELFSAEADFIKFDAALLRDLQEVNDQKFDLFCGLIDGLRKEGVKTVGEGVETDAMVELCQEIGFDLLQGFALSRPTIMSHS